MARAIYESIADWFRRDGHFWLQYTNLELEFGDLQYARLHLAHAESLMQDDDLVLTTKAHLGLRESCSAGSRQEAMKLRSDAEDILLEQIHRLGDEDEYPYHVYLTQMLSWIHRWELDGAARKTSLHNLFQVAIQAVERHPSNTQMRQIHDDIKREYLSQAALNRR